jgi:hypothetical protein
MPMRRRNAVRFKNGAAPSAGTQSGSAAGSSIKMELSAQAQSAASAEQAIDGLLPLIARGIRLMHILMERHLRPLEDHP